MAKKILVVDDDENIVKLITSRLRANNYEVVAAFDGVAAMTQAINEHPDLIILDLKMPAGGGVTVYDNLKNSSITVTIPVIFITAYHSEELRDKILAMGEDYISKPFNPEELLAKVSKALGEETK